MYRCLPREARHTTIFSSMTIWDKGGVNINTGEAGENIDCPVCVVLLFFFFFFFFFFFAVFPVLVPSWFWRGGRGGMGLSFYNTKFLSCYFCFVSCSLFCLDD